MSTSLFIALCSQFAHLILQQVGLLLVFIISWAMSRWRNICFSFVVLVKVLHFFKCNFIDWKRVDEIKLSNFQLLFLTIRESCLIFLRVRFYLRFSYSIKKNRQSALRITSLVIRTPTSILQAEEIAQSFTMKYP